MKSFFSVKWRKPRVPSWSCARSCIGSGRLFSVLGVVLVALAAVPTAAQQQWQPIGKDGLRDPASPAVKLLQPPAEALSKLAPDNAGNQVRWVRALEQGQITPRSRIYENTTVNLYEKDVFLNLRGGMPVVRFPHRAHTLWLDCSNCHDHLFKKEPNSNKLSMFAILQGEQCGVCHGAVAFPLTECSRCHSTQRADALAEIERGAAAAGGTGGDKFQPGGAK